jgi:hypothetical protein
MVPRPWTFASPLVPLKTANCPWKLGPVKLAEKPSWSVPKDPSKIPVNVCVPKKIPLPVVVSTIIVAVPMVVPTRLSVKVRLKLSFMMRVVPNWFEVALFTVVVNPPLIGTRDVACPTGTRRRTASSEKSPRVDFISFAISRSRASNATDLTIPVCCALESLSERSNKVP